MKSIPAASAMRARRKQSGQLADQRSGTLVAERPEEQLAPNTPSLSALPLYMAMRSAMDAVRASTVTSLSRCGRRTAAVWAERVESSLHERAVDHIVQIHGALDQALLLIEREVVNEARVVDSTIGIHARGRD